MLHKKDTYSVFSEPVDINELPDYFEVIKQPMDFGTAIQATCYSLGLLDDDREYFDGIDEASYWGLPSFLRNLFALLLMSSSVSRPEYVWEKSWHLLADDILRRQRMIVGIKDDVFLICSNAMQYNAPDTVYYRQARSIQDVAKRDFEDLRHEGVNGEPQPKVVCRGRPPNSKNQKKLLETPSPLNHGVGLGLSSLAAEDKANGSSSYNLRKTPPLNRFLSSDIFVG